MKVILKVASSINDVLAMVCGEDFQNPYETELAKHLYLFNR
ncbi:hypothetical protein ACFLW5_01040 [Chloroflexota bacterium]